MYIQGGKGREGKQKWEMKEGRKEGWKDKREGGEEKGREWEEKGGRGGKREEREKEIRKAIDL